MDRYISRNRLDSHMSDVCKWCRDTAAEFDGIMPDCEQCPLYRLKEKLEHDSDMHIRVIMHARWIERNNPSFSPFDDSSPYIYVCNRCGHESEKPTTYCSGCESVMI